MRTNYRDVTGDEISTTTEQLLANMAIEVQRLATETRRLREELAEPMDMVQVGGATIIDRKGRTTWQLDEDEGIVRGFSWGSASDYSDIAIGGDEGKRYWAWLCDHSDKATKSEPLAR